MEGEKHKKDRNGEMNQSEAWQSEFRMWACGILTVWELFVAFLVQAGIMGPQAVKVDDVEFSAKLTPPSSSTALELMGYGEFGVIVFTKFVRPNQSFFNCCKPHQ